MLITLDDRDIQRISGGINEPSGGDIIVLGQPTSVSTLSGIVSNGFSSSQVFTMGYGYTDMLDDWDPYGDDDGDGVQNMDETIVVEASAEQVSRWNAFSSTMTTLTQWYITLSSAAVGTEFTAFNQLLKQAFGEKMAALIAAAAGKAASDGSEKSIKDFWFNYARDIETKPNTNPLSYPQYGGYIYSL